MKLVQDTLRRFVDEGQIAGCAARIMKDDAVLYEGSFGWADIESKIKMSAADTIFPIASMSKVITVAGIMRLYEQGLLSCGTPSAHTCPDSSARASRWKSRTAPGCM